MGVYALTGGATGIGGELRRQLTDAGHTVISIDIKGGARLSGKVNGWNVGVLDIQADEIENAAGENIGAANNFGVTRSRGFVPGSPCGRRRPRWIHSPRASPASTRRRTGTSRSPSGPSTRKWSGTCAPVSSC